MMTRPAWTLRTPRFLCVILLLSWFLVLSHCLSLALLSSRYTRATHYSRCHRQSSAFLGDTSTLEQRMLPPAAERRINSVMITMRKQKASDKRTRRKQRGEVVHSMLQTTTTTITTSPMELATWKQKSNKNLFPPTRISTKTGGRGRSRKRTTVYQTLSHYQNHFLRLLTAEYQAEEEEVLGRIQSSLEDPLELEQAGYAVFDMQAERRGTLFADTVVYRLTKAPDAVSRQLPQNYKFSRNDVIVLTQQPSGSGDFFGVAPTCETAVTAEARILNTGPTYLDIAVSSGELEAAFGSTSLSKARLRVDLFVSNIPYQRMVAALSQLTAILPAPKSDKSSSADDDGVPKIAMDEILKSIILSTYAYTDPNSPLLHDPDVCNLEDLSYKIAKPPMPTSQKLAHVAMQQLQSHPNRVCDFNAPQLAAIQAALTRRLTLIQGPPGSGKTTVAAAIGYGFVRQCRSISEQNTKVLACAFSNVGADNLAEALLQLGLNVVRIGKPSAVTESLWDYTLDAAIDRDVKAQKALQNAAKATALLAKVRNDRSRSSKQTPSLSERTIRDAATAAVKASIEASNVAATKALREAHVIVATSVGAADSRLLRACGIVTNSDEEFTSGAADTKTQQTQQPTTTIPERVNAPDGLPPLSLPFVIVDEACQSVEPATLIPIISSNSCRSLVMLGDPCQLPPTIRSREGQPLAVSLMERLAATLPHPTVIPSVDDTVKDSRYLEALPVKQAVSLVRSRSSDRRQRSYRKLFSGSLLLSIQYRMHPSIAALPSALFYDGLLATPSFMSEARSFPAALNRIMPCGNPDMCVRLIDVGGQDNERQGTPSNKYTQTVYSSVASTSSSLEKQTTYWNEPEAERVISLVKDLLSSDGGDINVDPNIRSIGVISPYNGQVQLIKSMIASDSDLRDILQKLPVSIEVKSVDGYQGRERDVIIFSAVRSNRQERIGFLHDWRRMNVALTRAKSALLVVGDFQTLSAANKYWNALTLWATANRCILDDGSDDDEVSP